ncbi:uncharacterized protein si:ch211-127m7.2 [Tachysurus fulvidraco]|uniref:uncharacterized protein si:ch211-127m7.2 n=1 Tax=Tachysurus fulvidraco TaxID=1234273 RepID=UPI001FEF46A6|nr:uncharacterized protein si:ch211-127m7.2 [Tachysurus fulvidraco]
MSAKRNLPAWMVASDHKNGQTKESLKRKAEVNTNKRLGKKCIKRMMYWMNERELVEAAISVLNREPGPGERRAPLNTETTLIPETDHEETTDSDVSDPALDYAEQETVPYNDPLKERRCGSASESSGEQPLASSTGLDKKAESKEDNCQNNPDHEALQVLQDIFFS